MICGLPTASSRYRVVSALTRMLSVHMVPAVGTHVKSSWKGDGSRAFATEVSGRPGRWLQRGPGAACAYHRKTILAVLAQVVISLSFVPLGLIGTELMTYSDRGEFAVNIDLPLGTTIGKTDSTVKAVERIVAAMPEVERYLSTIGKQQSQWKNADQSTLGQVQVKLTDKRKRSRSTQAVMMAIKEQTADIPGLKTSFNTISMWGSANASPVQIELSKRP